MWDPRLVKLPAATLACRRSHPELEGHGPLLEQVILKEYDRLQDAYRDRVVDSRSSTHLHLACMALATRKALLPFLRDEAAVGELIGEHLGQSSHAALTYGA